MRALEAREDFNIDQNDMVRTAVDDLEENAMCANGYG